MTTVLYHTGLKLPTVELPDDVKLLHLPVIHISFQQPADPRIFTDFIREPCELVLMSRNAVEGFRRFIRTAEITEEYLRRCRCWCLGEMTLADFKQSFDLPVELPPRASARGLIAALEPLNLQRVVVVSAREPRHELQDWLSNQRIGALHLPVYRTGIQVNPDLHQHFSDTPGNGVIFTSPSTVRGFLKNLGLADLQTLSCKIYTIGPTTSDAVRASGGFVTWESPRQNLSYLIHNITGVRAAL